MRFNNIGTVLDHVDRHHGELMTNYEALHKCTEEQRLREMLEYLSTHEGRLRQALRRHLDDNGGVLSTRSRHGIELEHPHVLADLRERLLRIPLHEVPGLGMTAHSVLGDMYRVLSRRWAGNGESGTLWSTLTAFQQAETRRLLRDMVRLGF